MTTKTIEYKTLKEILDAEGRDYAQGYVDGIYAVIVRFVAEGFIDIPLAVQVDASMQVLSAGLDLALGGRDARMGENAS